LYRQTFKEDPRELVPAGSVKDEEREAAVIAAAQRRLITSVTVTDEELRTLAQRRADAILTYLTDQGSIGLARLFLQEADVQAGPNDGLRRTTLTLTAR
jgi:hypothetical protein